MKKKCSRCKKEKEVKEFHKSKKDILNRKPACKECIKIDSKEYYLNNIRKIKQRVSHYNKKYPEKHKILRTNNHLQKRYGLNLKEYKILLKYQNSVCAICKQKETRKDSHSNNVTKLSIDHCHKSGKVRGILCNKCNNGLGRFKDDIKLLKSAIDYLKRN